MEKFTTPLKTSTCPTRQKRFTTRKTFQFKQTMKRYNMFSGGTHKIGIKMMQYGEKNHQIMGLKRFHVIQSYISFLQSLFFFLIFQPEKSKILDFEGSHIQMNRNWMAPTFLFPSTWFFYNWFPLLWNQHSEVKSFFLKTKYVQKIKCMQSCKKFIPKVSQLKNIG